MLVTQSDCSSADVDTDELHFPKNPSENPPSKNSSENLRKYSDGRIAVVSTKIDVGCKVASIRHLDTVRRSAVVSGGRAIQICIHTLFIFFLITIHYLWRCFR